MHYKVKTISTEAVYHLIYKIPLLSIGLDKIRIPIIKKILTQYDIRLNDINFDTNKPSDKFLSFIKFYGQTLFDVSFGFEELHATIKTPKDENQIAELFGSFYKIISSAKEFLAKRHQVTIAQHFSIEGQSLLEYFENLNPYTPEGFINKLFGKGVIYSLTDKEHNLNVQIVLTNSLLYPNAIYTRIDYDFYESQFDFFDMFEVSRETYKFLMTEMGLEIVEQ